MQLQLLSCVAVTAGKATALLYITDNVASNAPSVTRDI